MPEEHFSYLAPLDVGDIELADGEDSVTSWIQALPLGTYHHPMYGEIAVTPERIQSFAANVKAKVRGQQLDIDYEHKRNPNEGGRAAGWILDAEDRGADGLWVNIEWTKRAAQAIKDKEYRYFSPEFADEWEDPKSKQKFKDVMFGGALTNRPFLKDILPVNLSEFSTLENVTISMTNSNGETTTWANGMTVPNPTKNTITWTINANAPTNEPDKGVKMDELLAKLREMLGLKADAAEDVVLEEVKTLSERIADDVQARKFEEDYPEQAAQMKTLAEKAKSAEVEKRLTEWSRHTESNKGIPVALHEDLAAYRKSIDGDEATKFDSIIDSILKTGLVDFSEDGSTGGEEDALDTEGKFLNLVQKHLEENQGMSFSDAAREIARKNPDLAAAWQGSAMQVAGEGGDN